MKQIHLIGQTETFEMEVPQSVAYNKPAVNHAISLTFSADCNSGMTATISATCFGSPNDEAVTGGEIDAFTNAGGTKTIFINGAILSGITVTISGRTAGTVRADYLGYGINDPYLEV